MTPSQYLAWIVGVGYCVGFLGLTLVAKRRAGTKVWLFDAPGQALPAWGFRLGFAALLLWPFTASSDWAGARFSPALATLGAGFALWAQWHMGKSWRIGAAEGATGALVTDGPFAVSRNPVFVGLIVLFWGTVPTAGWVMLAAAVVFTVSVFQQVKTEEIILGRQPAWQAYAERVPRWLGRP